MDPVTHTLTGYVISKALKKPQAFANPKSRIAFTLATTIAAVSPDSDAVARYYGGDTFYFMHHRTITHSLLGLLVLPFLCAALVKLLDRNSRFIVLLFGAVLGFISHILLDLTNTYSTLAFWPISSKMYSMDLLFIVDIVIILTFSISLLLSLLKPLRKYSQRISTIALAVVLVYTGSKGFIQHDLKQTLVQQYASGVLTKDSSPPELKRLSVMTELIGPNTWDFILENDKSFIKGKIKLSTHTAYGIETVSKKPVDAAIETAQNTPIGQFLLKFAPYIDYNVTPLTKGYLVRIIDLRYTFMPDFLKSRVSEDSHSFGGYVLLDYKYNVTYWSSKKPVLNSNGVIK